MTARGGTPVLELRGVALRLHGRVLVPPLDARLGPADVLAVMGPSGSGKSSLLAWLAGTLGPPFRATGTVWVDGVDVTGWPTEQRGIGLMLQDDWLFPHLSVQDNLLFALPHDAAVPRRERTAWRRAQAEGALQRAGLAGHGERWPHELSGGQRSRVALLRTLLARPRAVLLDEPFSRLDLPLRERTRAFVWQTLAEHGVPALLVTHDERDVPPLAQRVQLPEAQAEPLPEAEPAPPHAAVPGPSRHA